MKLKTRAYIKLLLLRKRNDLMRVRNKLTAYSKYKKEKVVNDLIEINEVIKDFKNE